MRRPVHIHDFTPGSAAWTPLVLIVDDAADMREYVASILGQHYRVATASDGERALAWVRVHRPDLILSDLVMPKMDGLTLCRTIKGDPLLKHTPLILLTARTTKQTRIDGLEAGADDYLDKPFDDRELLARVNNLLQLHHQTKALLQLNQELERRVEEQVQIMLQDRIKFEEQLMSAKEQVEQSLLLKSSILDNMNHEFRTPLASIRGYAQVLSQEVEGQLREFAQLIEMSGARLMRTLDAVHQLSRLDAGDLDLRPARIDLAFVLEAAGRQYAPLAAQKGLTLRVEVPEAAKMEALLNRHAVEQILGHLVDNAVKFTEDGEIVLAATDQREHLFVRVRDTGIGIDPTFKPHLFEAFTQESTGLTRSYEGIGIGLNVARRLAERLGGDISVESEKGQGSTFTVRFPRAVTPVHRATARAFKRRPVH